MAVNYIFELEDSGCCGLPDLKVSALLRKRGYEPDLTGAHEYLYRSTQDREIDPETLDDLANIPGVVVRRED